MCAPSSMCVSRSSGARTTEDHGSSLSGRLSSLVHGNNAVTNNLPLESRKSYAVDPVVAVRTLGLGEVAGRTRWKILDSKVARGLPGG
jgi:hypothetical protein